MHVHVAPCLGARSHVPTVPSLCPGMGARGAALGDEGVRGPHPTLVQRICPLVTGSRDLGCRIPIGRLCQAPHPCPIDLWHKSSSLCPCDGCVCTPGRCPAHPSCPDLLRGAGSPPGQHSLASQADLPNGARCSRSAHDGLKLKCSKLISHDGNQQTPKWCQSWHPSVKPLGLVPDAQDCCDPAVILAVSGAQGTLSLCHPWRAVSGEGPPGGSRTP